jgi:hypothetical protein
MPNWKTYESSVRLLSAIIAAHPDLKLNYDGKQAYFFTISPHLTSSFLHLLQFLIRLISILRYP